MACFDPYEQVTHSLSLFIFLLRSISSYHILLYDSTSKKGKGFGFSSMFSLLTPTVPLPLRRTMLSTLLPSKAKRYHTDIF